MATSLPIIRYALDPTGENPDNAVHGEQHILTTGRPVRAICMQYGSFFTDSLVVVDSLTSSLLIRDIDYQVVELNQAASALYTKEICVVVLITNPTLTQVSVDYQVLGGPYERNSQTLVDVMNNLMVDDRPVHWPDILGKPDRFLPNMHLHDIGDTYGWEFVCYALERIRNAILLSDSPGFESVLRYVDESIEALRAELDGGGAALEAHVTNVNNPHGTTKAQIQLGNVPNYGMGTLADVTAGATDKFASPALIKQYVTSAIGNLSSIYQGQLNRYTNYNTTDTSLLTAGEVVQMALKDENNQNLMFGHSVQSAVTTFEWDGISQHVEMPLQGGRSVQRSVVYMTDKINPNITKPVGHGNIVMGVMRDENNQFLIESDNIQRALRRPDGTSLQANTKVLVADGGAAGYSGMISSEPGNLIIPKDDGLYYAQQAPVTSLTTNMTINGNNNLITLANPADETLLPLVAGDVIKITGTGTIMDGVLRTVTGGAGDGGYVVVNHEHLGNPILGTLNFTGICTITLVVKGYAATTGLGRAWADLTTYRTFNTTYAPLTNRDANIVVEFFATPSPGAFYHIKGFVIHGGIQTLVAFPVPLTAWDASGNVRGVLNFTVPPGHTYRVEKDPASNMSQIAWRELC